MPTCLYEVGVKFKTAIRGLTAKEDYFDRRYSPTCIEGIRTENLARGISTILFGCPEPNCILTPDGICEKFEKDLRSKFPEGNSNLEINFIRKSDL